MSNDASTTDIYTLSLHDALPILLTSFSGLSGSGLTHTSAVASTRSTSASGTRPVNRHVSSSPSSRLSSRSSSNESPAPRSEEHTSELQSQFHLVCRLLLEKKKNE